MGYYIRVLSTSDQPIPLARLQQALERGKFKAVLECDAGEETKWEQITLSHLDGTAIASIERNVLLPDSLGESELGEFLDDIENERPASAVAWLRGFFPLVRTIYAFQFLSGTEVKKGGEILRCVHASIWNFAPAIIQADGEGFTNDEGYHILWQFSDRVKGPWAMGILKEDKWIHFQMDLGNRSHRDAFLNGRIPDGINPIE